MKTKDFIAGVVQGRISGRRICSSVFFDGNHLYSYGYHYPLLVQVGDKWILNDSGYSRTTSKHIGWAGSYADYIGSFKGTTPREILESVNAEYDRVIQSLAKLRKGAFRKESYLNSRQFELQKTRMYLNSVIAETV